MQKKNPIIGEVPEQFGQRRRIPKLPLIIVALIIGAFGAYVLVNSFAATQNSNCFSQPSACGYPDPTNTGLNASASAGGLGGDTSKLTASGSITASTPGQVIDAKDVTGTIEITANNVTVQNTRVTLNSMNAGCNKTNTCGNFEIIIDSGVTGTVIKNSELRTMPGNDNIVCEHDIRNLGKDVTIIGDYLHGCDSNLFNASTATMTDTYGITNRGNTNPLISTDHIENIYFNDSTVNVSHSTLLNPVEQTAVIFGDSNGGQSGGACSNHLTVTNSLLAGGGYTLYPCGNAGKTGSSSISITNNHFARCVSAETNGSGGTHPCKNGPDANGYYPGSGSFGIAAYYFSSQTWSGNVWDNNLQAVCADGSNGCGSSGNPTGPSDTTPPTVSITAPASGSSVSGSNVTISASASDDTGVAGVQFKLDGNNLGSEDTASPYGMTWDTSGVSNGTHTLTAVARDAAGNTKTSSNVTVTVNNTTGGGGGTGGAGCTVAATPSSFASVFSSAGSGAVICLAAGSYGTFNGGLKTGMVTIRPQDGVTASQVSMKVNFTAAAYITIDGVTIQDGSLINGSKTNNIVIKNSAFPGQIKFDASTLANANILLDHNVHQGFNATGDLEGRIQIVNDTSQDVGITIQNSQFLNGNSDGIQNGAKGVKILNNEFSGILQVDGSNVHADSIQLLGAPNTVVSGNYFHNDSDGIMCADGCDHENVTNNVFAINDSPFAITFLSDNGSTITHNTFVNGSCSFNLNCGIVKLGNKSGDPASTGTTLKDNILTSYGVSNGEGTTTGLASGAEGYNLLYNNPKAGPPSPNANDIIGSPTYVGGASPSTYAGYALASGSLGKGNASDGTDRGINTGSGGSGGGSGSDTTKPTVSFTAPTAGSTLSGLATATATASDNLGVAKVDFTLDNATSPAMSDTSSPYNYSFDTKTLTNGSHTLTAKAYDAAGNTSIATVTFTVNNADTTPPSTPTNVKATAANATTINLTWTASTDSGTNATGVAKYNVLRNGVVIGQPTTTSYTDTTAVADTSYSYTVVAIDGAGNSSATSAAATVKTPTAGGGSTGSCTKTLSVGANVGSALSSAAPGDVICLNAGTWAAQNFAGIAPSSTVTLQPAPGATVHTGTITLNGPGNTKNLTVKGLYIDGGVQGLCGIDGNVVFQNNTIQNIKQGNAFYFYANSCGGSHVQTGVSILNNQMDHVGECITVAGGASIEKNFTFKNNVCGPVIGYGVTQGNQYSHYIEIGCMAGGTFDNNAFLGPYDTTALSNTNTATAVHNNVFHCFGDGSNISFSNNIIWHAQSRAQTVLVQSGKMDNITINNNLFVNDPFCHTTSNNCPAQDIEVYATHGLAVTNNTVVNTSWGLHFPGTCTDGCYSSGTNETLTNNIVESAAVDGNADYSDWSSCASGCVTGSNVSYDTSAVGTPSVKNWTPSYTATNWTPPSGGAYSPPPSGYYVAKGLPFTAGWDGTGGPQGGVGAGSSSSSGSSDTTPPSTPTNVQAVPTNTGQVNLTWNASTDSGGSGLAGYNVYRNGSKLNSSLITSTSYGDATAQANTTYTYTVEAVDGAQNASAKSTSATATTPPPADTTAPTVSLTAPSNNATVSGTSVTVSADATDNVGVANVQFKVDGTAIGGDATNPYSVSWNSTTIANGTHTLTAVATDTAGNTKTSSSITVTVNNSTAGGGGGTGGSSSCSTTVSSTSAAQSAVSGASSGQVICLSDGTYGALTLSSSKPVTLQAQNPGKTTVGAVSISGSGLTFANFNTTGEITVQPGASNVIISHNKITGGYFGVDACSSTTTTCNDVKIIGNKFQGPYGEDAIRANRYHDANGDGFGLIVSENEITGVVENGNHSDCLQTVWVGDGIDFDHNYEHDNRCQGFFIKDQNSLCGSGTSGVCGTVTNVKVYDNIFTRNNEPCAASAPGCGQPTTIQLFGPEDGVSIDRNTMWGGDLTLTLRDPGWSNVHVTNNAASRKWSDTTAPFNSTYSASNNLFCNTTYSGSWPDTGFSSNCNPPFPGPTLAQGDNFMLGGSQGVDWQPGQYTYGPSGSAGSGGGSSADTTKPSVSFTAPAAGSTLSGIATATATASDNVGVTKVAFTLDNATSPAMTATASPYNFSFDTKTLGNGSHKLTAQAYDAAGNTTSSTVTFTVNNADTTPPSTPTNVKATAANATTVNLTWTASTDSGTNATGVAKYNVLRNGVVIGQPTTNSYTDSTAVANTTYSYVIQAVDGAGNVSGSSTAAAITTPKATTTNQDLLFNGTKISDYLNQSAPGAITQVADPAGGNQQVFKFVVKNSDVAPVTPTENPRAQLVGPDDINLGSDVWLKNKFYLPSDFPSNVPGWMALFATYGPPFDGSGPWEVSINGTQIQWQRNDTYNYDIPWSTPIVKNQWINVLVHEKLDTKGFIEMWVNGQQITFFAKNSSHYYNPNNVSPTTLLNMQTADHTNNGGANSGRVMEYRQLGLFNSVTTYHGPLIIGKTEAAVNAADEQDSGSSTTPPPQPDTTPPSTPANVNASADSANQVNLTWNASTDSGGSGLAGYNIYRNGAKLNSNLVTSTSYGDATAQPDMSYSYTIEAVDGAKNVSPKSSAATVKTPAAPDTTPPSIPSGLKATAASPTEVDLSWNASTDNTVIAGYNIYRNGTKVNTAPIASAVFKDAQVSPNTSYQYAVQAVDGAGNVSDKTGTVSVTTPQPQTGGGSGNTGGNSGGGNSGGGQQHTVPVVRITVFDTHRRIAPGATVTLNGQTVQANSHGVAQFTNVPTGKQSVTIDYGNKTVTKDVRVKADKHRHHSIQNLKISLASTTANPALLLVPVFILLAAALMIFRPWEGRFAKVTDEQLPIVTSDKLPDQTVEPGRKLQTPGTVYAPEERKSDDDKPQHSS